MPSQSPTWSEAILGAIEARLQGFYTSLPGRVESFDGNTGRALVQPMVTRTYYDEAGEQKTERHPPIPDVPILFDGSGSRRTTYPVRAGDLVLLVITSCSLDRVLSIGEEVDPQDDRRNHPSDAVAIPGFYAFNSVPTTVPDDAVVVHSDLEIKLGGPGADQAVMRGNVYRVAEDNLLTALGTFATAIGALDPLTSSAAATTLNLAITTFKTAAANYLSAKVRVE